MKKQDRWLLRLKKPTPCPESCPGSVCQVITASSFLCVEVDGSAYFFSSTIPFFVTRAHEPIIHFKKSPSHFMNLNLFQMKHVPKKETEKITNTYKNRTDSRREKLLGRIFWEDFSILSISDVAQAPSIDLDRKNNAGALQVQIRCLGSQLLEMDVMFGRNGWMKIFFD